MFSLIPFILDIKETLLNLMRYLQLSSKNFFFFTLECVRGIKIEKVEHNLFGKQTIFQNGMLDT